MKNLRDGLVARISELSPEKRAVLDRLLRAQSGDVALAVIRPRRASDPRPLSFAQQRLWFLSQVRAGDTLYNCVSSWWLEGALDVSALVRALNEIVRRHEALRTTFPLAEGLPVQHVAPWRPFEVPLIDLSGLEEGEREAELRRVNSSEVGQPFDLAAGPLVRLKLLRVEPTRHILLFEVHHIVFDGWSVGVFLRELAALYEAFVGGNPSPLPDLPVQYSDFAAWQREWMQAGVLESQLAYWRERLAGPLPVLELPIDRPRPAVPRHEAGAHAALLPAGVAEALRELGRREGATLFMTLLAGFQALLSRYTGQEDVVVGSPIAGRTRREVEGLVGFFVNSLVLRGRLDGDPTFRELLARARETTLGAYANPDLPFERLVEELHPERDLTRNPLFQVMFALQSAPLDVVPLPGLTLRLLDGGSVQTRLDWELHVSERADGVNVASLFRKDLFDTGTIERMVGSYRTLLEDAVAHPDRRVSELAVLTPAERRHLVVEWNETRRELPHVESVTEAFERWAKRAPDAIAVASGGERRSYSDVNRRANRLARVLRKLGVGPEVRVGVCADRSAEMVVALLAILKAGGAYVPLDAAYPRERLAFILRDSRVAVLLAQSGTRGVLPATETPVLSLDDDESECFRESDADLEVKVEGGNLAYVIYTSGSTGRPKGVEITHDSLRNLVAWHQRVYEVTPADRATLVAAPGFDASVWELWPYLAAGASVHVPDEDTRADPSMLVRWLSELEITLCFLPTPLAEAVLQEKWSGGRLRALLTGGDKLHRSRLRETSCPVFNHYGPTEGTVVATWGRVNPAEIDATDPPIGRPVDNARVYVLDAALRPVPVGVAGELYLGGDGLARGYLGRPDLTAERFAPDPFAEQPGGRLYRTGDRGRYRPDGSIEFLGRTDEQVKVRGIRIELGEIEAVLGTHPAVKECVVILREDTPGDPRLAAYVVPRGPVEIDDMVRHLEAELPSVMVPSAFVLLPLLPVSPNGKVDRRALPSPSRDAHPGYEAPRGEVERRIAGIWQEVLGIERVGARENFFDLGGHSMLLIQVHRRLRAAFPDRALAMVELFEHPTVGALAAHLRRSARADRDEERSEDRRAIAERLRDGRSRLQRRREMRDRTVSGESIDV